MGKIKDMASTRRVAGAEGRIFRLLGMNRDPKITQGATHIRTRYLAREIARLIEENWVDSFGNDSEGASNDSR